MSNLKIQAIFSFIDKVSAPLAKVSKSASKMEATLEKVSAASSRVSKKFQKQNEDTKRLDKSQKEAAKSAEKFGKIWGAIFGGAIGYGATKAVGGILDINAAFEDYTNTLETALGSQLKAKQAMDWVSNFAATTPYELNQVTDAYVKLINYGIDPQARAMRTLGDTASGMKKSYDQAIEALVDAKTGEFERLKEFGIRTSVQGQKVVFTYNKLGKEIKVITTKAGDDIEKNLLDIWDSKFAGQMDKASKGFNGLKANLKDIISIFQLKIGQFGFFEHVKTRMDKLYSSLSSKKAQAKISVQAKKISDALIRLFDTIDKIISSIDWVKFIDGISNTIAAIEKFLKVFGGIENLINLGIAGWLFGIVFGLNGVAAALGLVSIAGVPIAGIITLIGLFAASAFLLWRNWDGVSKWFMEKLNWLWNAYKGLPVWLQTLLFTPAAIIANFEKIKSIVGSTLDAIWNLMPAWFRGLVNGTLKLIVPSVNFMQAKTFPTINKNNSNPNQTMNAHLVVDVNGGRVSDFKSSDKNFKVTAKEKLGLQGVY